MSVPSVPTNTAVQHRGSPLVGNQPVGPARFDAARFPQAAHAADANQQSSRAEAFVKTTDMKFVTREAVIASQMTWTFNVQYLP